MKKYIKPTINSVKITQPLMQITMSAADADPSKSVNSKSSKFDFDDFED